MYSFLLCCFQNGPRTRRLYHPYATADGGPGATWDGEPYPIESLNLEPSAGPNAAPYASTARGDARRGSLSSFGSVQVGAGQPNDGFDGIPAAASDGGNQMRSYLPFRRISSASAPDAFMQQMQSGASAGNPAAPVMNPMRRPSVPLISGDLSPDVVSTRRMSNLTIDESIEEARSASGTAEEKVNGSRAPLQLQQQHQHQQQQATARYARETAASSAQRQYSPQAQQPQPENVSTPLTAQARRRTPTPKIWGHHSISTVTNTPQSGRRQGPLNHASSARARASGESARPLRQGNNGSGSSPQHQSPQLQDLVQSGRRNGIPVTTVNLGMSGGIRRAAAALGGADGRQFNEFTTNLLASASFSPDSRKNDHNFAAGSSSSAAVTRAARDGGRGGPYSPI